MSGGSYNYECFRVHDVAEQIRNTNTDPRRAAFQKLLLLVSDAMHDIEWVDSCDYGPGDDHAAIDAVFASLTATPEIIIKAAAYDNMKELLQKFFKNDKV
jgi:hypothetical protein